MEKFGINWSQLNYFYKVIRCEEKFENMITGRVRGRTKIVTSEHIEAIQKIVSQLGNSRFTTTTI